MKERITQGPRKSLPERAVLFVRHLPHKLRVEASRLNPDIFLPERKQEEVFPKKTQEKPEDA